MEAPRDDLTRRVPFTVERSENGDGLTLSGYAAVFNELTRIDSWEGNFDEQIAPGAFKRSINARTPVLQFDHGSHPMIGSIPLGAIKSLREDRRGLYVEARLHDNWLVEPIRDAIRDGSVTGMSFRFNVVKDEWDESGDIPVRTLKEVRLHELGPVVWPAYEQTTVGVRSKYAELISDPEFVREVARAITLGTMPNGTSEEPAPEGTSEEPAADDSREHSSIPNSLRAKAALASHSLKELAK